MTNFIPHDRLKDDKVRSHVHGYPAADYRRYQQRKWQLNQIDCHYELMSLGSVERLTNWYHIGRVLSRLQRIHMGVSVDSPHWSSLIQVKEMV